MVVFTCTNCGESLKKNKVDNHYLFKCRSRPLMTCVDCLKDFDSKEYSSHTKCISEEERYGAKGFVPKASANKGERKQAERMRLLSDYVQKENVTDTKVREVLQFLAQIESVPNKKKALFNMLKNHGAFRRIPDQALEDVWAVMEEINKGVTSAFQIASGSQKVGKENGEDSQDRDNEVQGKQKKKKVKGVTNSGESISDVACEGSAEVKKEEEAVENTLSKKEQKGKRKKERYERELMAIESQANGKPEMGEIEPESTDKTNVEKLRKRKYSEVNEEGNKENGVNLSDEADGSKSRRKKKKKRHEKEDLSERHVSEHKRGKKHGSLLVEVAEPTVEKSEEMGDVSKRLKSDKFNWEETIISILRKKNELSLKRLQKKVVKEYVSSGPHVVSIEKAVAKFNKKVMKIPCVEVKKEVAKLVME